MPYTIPCISMSLCGEKLRLNCFQGLGNTLLSQRCQFRHEAAFHKGQYFVVFSLCSALSFVL